MEKSQVRSFILEHAAGLEEFTISANLAVPTNIQGPGYGGKFKKPKHIHGVNTDGEELEDTTDDERTGDMGIQPGQRDDKRPKVMW